MTLLRAVFEQPDAEATERQMDRAIDTLHKRFPVVADHLEAARWESNASGSGRAIWMRWSRAGDGDVSNPGERQVTWGVTRDGQSRHPWPD